MGQPPDRLSTRLSGRGTTQLRGTRHPRIASALDQGPMPDEERIEGIQISFRPSPIQSAELARLLDDQRNPASPHYRKWLTPEEFGARFGLSGNDLSAVTGWLTERGFRIDHVSRSQTYLTFSGTAAQVRDTFQTEIHRYRAAGRTHYASMREAHVPAALAPLLFTIRGLDDFGRESKAEPSPHLLNSAGKYSVAPSDLATIYKLTPIYERGIDGSGQKIVIPGHHDIHIEDVRNFRSQFGLPENDPQTILVPGYPNPGNDDDSEPLLDLEIAGSIAPKATLIYVFAREAYPAVLYAIDQNLAPVISTSFGGCETTAYYLAAVDPLRFLAQQANAQGITWVAASGDAGAAVCESHMTDSIGVGGTGATMPGSLPEVTAVGGTEFAEGGGAYWDPKTGAALSYIPEIAWNNTALVGRLLSTGGGASMLFPKPDWQNAPGVPNDFMRGIPDISFNASPNHDGYRVVIHGEQKTFGGTSASAPFFAGALALLNQQLVDSGALEQPGLGNINPRLYELARTVPAVFHDVTSGDNIVPCRLGTPDCPSSRQYGYKAGPGYDLATGLGSIDFDSLFRNWIR